MSERDYPVPWIAWDYGTQDAPTRVVLSIHYHFARGRNDVLTSLRFRFRWGRPRGEILNCLVEEPCSGVHCFDASPDDLQTVEADKDPVFEAFEAFAASAEFAAELRSAAPGLAAIYEAELLRRETGAPPGRSTPRL